MNSKRTNIEKLNIFDSKPKYIVTKYKCERAGIFNPYITFEEEKRTGLKSLTKEEADTMVCDGAKLNLFSFSYNLKIYYENKKIKNVYEKTILKMDNDLELTEKVEVKGKEKE